MVRLSREPSSQQSSSTLYVQPLTILHSVLDRTTLCWRSDDRLLLTLLSLAGLPGILRSSRHAPRTREQERRHRSVNAIIETTEDRDQDTNGRMRRSGTILAQ